MENKKVVLYAYYLSSCSWRVRTALNIKKIRYDVIPISMNGKQNTPEYRKINPMGYVPALIIDNLTLIESMNILEYLEETRPDIPLLPKDIAKRSQARQICQLIISGIQPLQNTRPQLYVGGGEKGKDFARHFIKIGFEPLEKLLLVSAGTYCVGDELTLADCCLVPQVYNAIERYNMDLTAYPTIVRIYKELEKHPAFIASHPMNQPDYEANASKANTPY